MNKAVIIAGKTIPMRLKNRSELKGVFTDALLMFSFYDIEYMGVPFVVLESKTPVHLTPAQCKKLTSIIKMLNDTYGLELSEENKVELNKMRQRVVDDEELMGFFNTNKSRDDVKKMFEEKIDEELLNFINSKLELYNKQTEDRANGIFKSIYFNELYDQRVRGLK